jgi:hypothetical protein
MDDKHSDVGQENARSIIIEGWMRMVLATGGIERFDDLHIDKIDPHGDAESLGSMEAQKLWISQRKSRQASPPRKLLR